MLSVEKCKELFADEITRLASTRAWNTYGFIDSANKVAERIITGDGFRMAKIKEATKEPKEQYYFATVFTRLTPDEIYFAIYPEDTKWHEKGGVVINGHDDVLRKILNNAEYAREMRLLTIEIQSKIRQSGLPVTINQPKTEYGIVSEIAEEYDMDYTDFVEYVNRNTRDGDVVAKRRVVHAVLFLSGKLSLEQIGLSYGKRDHATVLHSKKRVSELYQTYKPYREHIDRILTRTGLYNKRHLLYENKNH